MVALVVAAAIMCRLIDASSVDGTTSGTAASPLAVVVVVACAMRAMATAN